METMNAPGEAPLIPAQIILWIGAGTALAGCFLAFLGSELWAIVLLAGVGLTLAAWLVRQGTLLVLCGHALLLGEAALLLLTLLWHVAGYPLTPQLWYGGGSVIFAGIALLLQNRARASEFRLWGKSDIIILSVAAVVLAYGGWVARANGYTRGPDGQEQYVAHGYLNGDTSTLFALTWRAQESGRLPTENPFAANGELEYPALLHGMLGILLGTVHGDITKVAWLLMIPAVFGVAGLMAALSDVLGSKDISLPWWVGGALLALLYSWQDFIYPQSHLYLLGLFLVLVFFLVAVDRSSGRERATNALAAWCVALVLLFSNAVLGTAAVAVFSGVGLLAIVKKNSFRERSAWAAGAVVLCTFFLLFPPGEGGIGRLNIPYTVFLNVFSLAVPALLVLAGLRRSPLKQYSSLTALAVLLPLLTVITLFFSRRDIVADNASRFLYLLLFALWPVAVPFVKHLADSWVREVRYHALPIGEHAVTWAYGALAVLALALPPLALLAQATQSLIVGPANIVSADELAAFDWIRTHTPPRAVVARAPERLLAPPAGGVAGLAGSGVMPLGIPAFTGRALVRSDFWLSPADDVAQTAAEVFSGQRSFTDLPAAYVFCGPEGLACPAGDTLFAEGKVRVVRVR